MSMATRQCRRCRARCGRRCWDTSSGVQNVQLFTSPSGAQWRSARRCEWHRRRRSWPGWLGRRVVVEPGRSRGGADPEIDAEFFFGLAASARKGRRACSRCRCGRCRRPGRSATLGCSLQKCVRRKRSGRWARRAGGRRMGKDQLPVLARLNTELPGEPVAAVHETLPDDLAPKI